MIIWKKSIITNNQLMQWITIKKKKFWKKNFWILSMTKREWLIILQKAIWGQCSL